VTAAPGTSSPPPAVVAPPAGSARERYRAETLVALLQLRWFVRLRWAIVGTVLVLLGIERWAVHASRPAGLWAAVLVLAGTNFLWSLISRTMHRQADAPDVDQPEVQRGALLFANAQVAVDLLLLTLILRFTGGIENPMAIFYLFHMAIGSLLLTKWQAILQGVWAVALYGTLAIGEWQGWLTHYAFLPGLAASPPFQQPLSVATVVAVVASGVFGTLFFTLHIAARLDERENQLRRAHDALRLSQRAIFDLQQRRSRFMQTAAHQLKSPLAGIQTLVGLIRDKVVPPDAIESTCDKVIRRCREGITQVTELLTYARVTEAEPNRHQGAATDVGAVTGDACQRFAHMAESKKINLHVRVPAEQDLIAHVHESDLRNCIDNLIDNAIKYTPGPGAVSVAVGRHRVARGGGASTLNGSATDYISVTVKDTGIGIDYHPIGNTDDPHGAGSIFDAFRRGNEALAAGIPGTGLGLSIVREVVEQVGGQVRVHSRPGQGATFTVTFPAQRDTPPEPAIRNTRSSEIFVEKANSGAGLVALAGAEEANHAG
jgi:signal transduction histidine kinase